MLITADREVSGALKGVGILLMDAQSVDETKSKVICPGHGIKNHTWTIIANATVAGVGITGGLALETNNDPTDTSGWNLLGGAVIDLSTIVVPAGKTRGVLEVEFSNIIITAGRGRIDTVVAGGTVSLVYTGQ